MRELPNAVKKARGIGTVAPTVPSPPVIILNLFYSGLGIARQLAGTGVHVVGLSADPSIYGNFSRFMDVRVAPNSLEHPRELADFLIHAASELHGAIIFPTRDADLIFLDRFRSELEPLYRLALPPRNVLFGLMDKDALAETAKKAGIAIPRTTTVRDRSGLQSAAELVGFPCVLKPVSSVHWREGSNWATVGGRKACRAETIVELKDLYDKVSKARNEILLQEWVPGGTDQILVWGGYARRALEPLAFFTAKKLLQVPDEFGTGCVVESESIPELLEPSVRLCRALDYEGIAEIEYKRDSRDGTLKLIEINARHWDWHQLGISSQVNLTWIAYCQLLGRPAEAVQPVIRRSKWIAEDAFLTHTLSACYSGTIAPMKVMKSLAGNRIYGVFAWNDPLPFLRYSTVTMLPALANAALRKIRNRSSRRFMAGKQMELNNVT